jgi:hypothetical protein
MPVEPNNIQPAAVMERRFNAQRDADFATIFATSHRLSTLRRHFTQLSDYLDYARNQLAGQVTIDSWHIHKTQTDGTVAYVLVQLAQSVQGMTETFIEVAELRCSQQVWSHLRSWRLPNEVTLAQALQSELKMLITYPDVCCL